jgi:hypothetical protein
MDLYEMKVDLPFLSKDTKFFIDHTTGIIWGCESDGKMIGHPVREGLRGYIWMLMTSGDAYIEFIE